jgi:hypothetical protein
MTLNELIDRLQELVEDDEANGERDVRIAYQPSYPLQSTVRGVCTSADAHDYSDSDESDADDCIYVVEGHQHRDRPYAPHGAFEAAS